MYTNVGRVILVGQSEQGVDELEERVVKKEVLRDINMTENLVELQKHMEGLNLRILDCQTEEIPMRL